MTDAEKFHESVQGVLDSGPFPFGPVLDAFTLAAKDGIPKPRLRTEGNDTKERDTEDDA